MSPASKTKSKSSGKAAKEQRKASIKPSGSANTGNGTPASAYNPISGTFHTLDTSPVTSSPSYNDNSRFRNIDDTDDHSVSPLGLVFEYDSVSNNDSCSGESEDPKEKLSNSTRQEPIPGSDNDRREKIRLKNEKKHQRQKEKRAQELHERCCGYLMSRKLEVLSQQLVAMGFSSERATLALMLNEGRVEESINWLFEVSEESQNPKHENGGNLKIDIIEELARISTMEVMYKCTKQEVERAVVTGEGDLNKAEESLKAQKQEPPATPPKPEDNLDIKNLVRPLEKLVSSVTTQQRRNDRDFNYTKAAATVPSTYSESGTRNQQSPVSNQPRPLADKRWATSGSSPVPLTAPTPMQVVSPAKVEVRNAFVGNEGRNIQQVREPVIVMQRPQSMNGKQIPISGVTSSPPVTAGWYAKNVPAFEIVRPNGKILQSTGSFSIESQSSEPFYRQAPYKEIPYMHNQVDSTSASLGGSWSTIGPSSPPLAVLSKPRSSQQSTMGMSSPSLAVPSSLGLFASWGSTGNLGSSSHVDWNTGGLIPDCDYNSIDWSLDTSLSSSRPNGLWGLSSLLRNGSGMRIGSTNGTCMSGLQDSEVVAETSSSAGLHEWTSPFAEKDIFSVPRQFVTSPPS